MRPQNNWSAHIKFCREVGSGPTEEALVRWLEEQGDRMEALKKGLDQKQRELARTGSRGQGPVQRQGSNRQKELSLGGPKVRPSIMALLERGPRNMEFTEP